MDSNNVIDALKDAFGKRNEFLDKGARKANRITYYLLAVLATSGIIFLFFVPSTYLEPLGIPSQHAWIISVSYFGALMSAIGAIPWLIFKARALKEFCKKYPEEARLLDSLSNLINKK